MKSKLLIVLIILGLLLLISCRSETSDNLDAENSSDTENSSILAAEEDATDNNKMLKIENVNDIKKVKKLFEDAINYENWFSGEWSTVWELNNAGKIKADFYYNPKGGTIYAHIDKKLSLGNKKAYVLLMIIKDAWGYDPKPSDSRFLELSDLEDEIRTNALEKIGTDYIDIEEVKMPDFSELTQAKLADIEKVVTYIEKSLKEENKKGMFTIYFSDFIKEAPIVNVIIQDEKGEKWYGSYSLNTDGSISSVLPNDYMLIETEDLEYYANQIKKIAVTKEVRLE
jgi:hypothetical protein